MNVPPVLVLLLAGLAGSRLTLTEEEFETVGPERIEGEAQLVETIQQEAAHCPGLMVGNETVLSGDIVCFLGTGGAAHLRVLRGGSGRGEAGDGRAGGPTPRLYSPPLPSRDR